MSKKKNISAVILAKNAQDTIESCLSQLAWVDDLLVIDNGSTDDTAQIAKKHKARVVSVLTGDFAHLRNKALYHAKGTWVFYVDSDEIIPPALAKEIQHIVSKQVDKTSPVAYKVRRINYYLGRKWPFEDMLERLFLKTAITKWTGAVHESPVFEGNIDMLVEPMLHNTHRSLEQMVAKTIEWSTMEAELRYDVAHPPVVWWRFLRVGLTGFFDSYVLKLGLRSGTAGIIESIYQGFSLIITYAKLWELQKK